MPIRDIYLKIEAIPDCRQLEVKPSAAWGFFQELR